MGLGLRSLENYRWIFYEIQADRGFAMSRFVVKRMVLVQIEYNLKLTLSWCRDNISKKGGNAPRATD